MRLEYFQMVDRITALDVPGGRITASCQVPEQSPVFEGHFPGYPILPGVLMIETMAQTGGWLVLATSHCARMPFLMQVEKAKMRSFVEPGQSLDVTASLLHDGSGYAVIKASITAGGKKVAEADIRFGVVAFPNETLRDAMLATARRIGLPPEVQAPEGQMPEVQMPKLPLPQVRAPQPAADTNGGSKDSAHDQ